MSTAKFSRFSLVLLATALLPVALLLGCARSEQKFTPLNEHDFTGAQLFYINTAKSMYTIGLEIGDTLTEQQKADFFKWVISTDIYSQKCKTWYDGTQYKIPLADIETIIFTHLDTAEFSPEKGFGPLDTKGSNGYDAISKEYISSMIGGYGGAAALGVLEYTTVDNQIKITLGSYNMQKFYLDTPEYELQETYEVNFLANPTECDKYKIVSSEPGASH